MAIWLRFKSWIIAVGAAVAAIVGVYMYGRHSGSLRELQKQAEADRKKARGVEDAADKARRTPIDDPVGRLSDRGRLRD
jgi:hypothetical protein